jgi:starch phosphorylase
MADEVLEIYKRDNYDPWDIYNMNQSVRQVLTQLINGSLSDDVDLFRDIYNSLLNGFRSARPDEYLILKDFESYALAQEQVSAAYKDKERWARSAIMNVASSGKFSSDRTIKQYADEIWSLKPIKIEM